MALMYCVEYLQIAGDYPYLAGDQSSHRVENNISQQVMIPIEVEKHTNYEVRTHLYHAPKEGVSCSYVCIRTYPTRFDD